MTSVPIGQVSCLELPAGMIDSVNDGIKGTASKEMEEECGIKLRPSDLVDLTELACQQAVEKAIFLAWAYLLHLEGVMNLYNTPMSNTL